MPTVTVHLAHDEYAWCVHFVLHQSQIPIGPWLLFGSEQEIFEKVFSWGNITEEELAGYRDACRCWGRGSAHIELTDVQCVALAERGSGWPWNGYELLKMNSAGKYPPQPLTREQMKRWRR